MKDAASGNSLPDEGKKALEKEIDGYRTIDNFSVPSSYRVKSAKKATITHRLYDEIWCVVIDPQFIPRMVPKIIILSLDNSYFGKLTMRDIIFGVMKMIG